MAQRQKIVAKRPDDILETVFVGHSQAKADGSEFAMRYLINYLEKCGSIPNAVKFFIYDLLAEDAYQVKDQTLCRQAVERAGQYLAAAQEESPRQLAGYLPKLRFIERGISVMVDAGEFETALSLCDLASQLGLGLAYAAKKDSIERML